MANTIGYKWQRVPEWIADGNHAQYILPVAKKVLTDCVGQPLKRGVDVGCKKVEWAYPNAIPVDIALGGPWTANKLPDGLDYIFSSHCLEHLDDPHLVLRYWYDRLVDGGKIFLYLPHPNCLYWQPHEMRDGIHKHQFTPHIIRDLLVDDVGFSDVCVSDCDLAYSFAAYGKKVTS